MFKCVYKCIVTKFDELNKSRQKPVILDNYRDRAY